MKKVAVFGNAGGGKSTLAKRSSSMQAYRVIRLCHRDLTPKYRQLVAEAAPSKRVHHLKSPREIRAFVDALGKERQPR